jgi:excisionase family DNA binding protein
MTDLLSLPRQARRLGVTQKWLREQADAGRIPCLKAGNRYLFNPTAVQEMLTARAAKTQHGGGDDEK